MTELKPTYQRINRVASIFSILVIVSNTSLAAPLYDIINIGLIDSEHTNSRDGSQSNVSRQLNEAGQVNGEAWRYNGSTYMGLSAWLYDGSSTIEIGLTGSDHTRDDGLRYNSVSRLNEAGQVIGTANRYNGATSLGFSAWIYNGSNTTEIGLTGNDYTDSDGYQRNFTSQLNEAGQVIGTANRYSKTINPYSGTTDMGQSAWISNGTSTSEIGLTDSNHTRDDGYQYNTVNQLNEAGQVTGTAERYNGASGKGQSAWFYDGSSTSTEIGLTGSEHTRNGGYQFNNVNQLNEAGQVTGNANRYNGDDTFMGTSAWFYDGSNTIKIGLTGIEYTRDDGYQINNTTGLNDAGQVVGYAVRYNGSTEIGRSAWFYDAELDQIFSYDFSVLPINNYAYSHSVYLSDDGLMLGYYQKYDIDNAYLGNYAFSFTIDDGFLDLGLLVDGFDDDGWLSLASAISSNKAGQIIGNGTLDGVPGSSTYLLTPQVSAVPVPSAVWFFGSGLIGLIGFTKRKKA